MCVGQVGHGREPARDEVHTVDAEVDEVGLDP
jgi:hypothetical protein